MTVRSVLAGCGSMGNRWLEYLLARSDVEMVALVDIFTANAEMMNERHGLQLPVYDSVARAIEDTGAELLLDTSIPDAHADNALTAMKLGASVMMEKPMSVTMRDASQLIEVSEQTSQFCAVMQNRRYTKEIRSLKQDLDAGVIGTPGFFSTNFFLGPRFGGFRELMDHPLLLDMAIHTFDAARYLIGAEPVSVYCHEFNPEGTWYTGNASAVCIFEFNNGAVFSYNGSWSALGHATSWEGAWRINGSKGTALWDGDSPARYQVIEQGAATDQAVLTTKEGIIYWSGQERRDACLNEMFDALLTGTRSETDIRDNIHSVAMMLGAIESAKRQQRILLSELY